jgi:hypothetical protein
VLSFNFATTAILVFQPGHATTKAHAPVGHAPLHLYTRRHLINTNATACIVTISRNALFPCYRTISATSIFRVSWVHATRMPLFAFRSILINVSFNEYYNCLYLCYIDVIDGVICTNTLLCLNMMMLTVTSPLN